MADFTTTRNLWFFFYSIRLEGQGRRRKCAGNAVLVYAASITLQRLRPAVCGGNADAERQCAL